MPTPRLSIVIPAYNEERRLPPTLEKLFAYLPTLGISYEIIIVDDGSRDGTVDVVKKLSEHHPQLRLISDGINRGRTLAMRKGFEEAHGDFILESDADGSVAEEAIGRCLLEFEENAELDCVFGSRELPDSRMVVWQPPLRVFLGYGFLYLTRTLFGMWNITDFALGFKMFRRDAARDIFAHIHEPYVVAEAEIIYIARMRGHTFMEIPVTWTDDADSRIDPFKEIFRSFFGLIRIVWRGITGVYQQTSSKDFIRLRPIFILFFLSVIAGLGATTAIYVAATAQGLDPTVLTGDAKGYVILASNLLENHAFSVAPQAPFYPESFRSPGYPFFLAVLYALAGSWLAVLFVQSFLLSVAPVLLYLLFRSYHERAAFWGAVVFALEPVRLFYSSSLLSDALFTCVLLGSLILLDKGRRDLSWKLVAFSGVVIGLGILIRPIALFLPLLYGGYLIWMTTPRRQGLLLAGVVCAVAIGTVLPWSLRNHAFFGSYNVSSVGAANLMLYNAPTFVAYNPTEQNQAVLATFKAEQESLSREDALSLERSEVFTNTFREIIRGQEVSYVLFHVVKTVPFFITDGLRDTMRLLKVDVGTMPNFSTALLQGRIGLALEYVLQGSVVGTTLLLLGVTFWSAVTLLSLMMLYKIVHGTAPKIWLFFIVVVLYFALLTGPVSNARYRLAVEGILLVSAISVVLTIRNREKQS